MKPSPLAGAPRNDQQGAYGGTHPSPGSGRTRHSDPLVRCAFGHRIRGGHGPASDPFFGGIWGRSMGFQRMALIIGGLDLPTLAWWVGLCSWSFKSCYPATTIVTHENSRDSICDVRMWILSFPTLSKKKKSLVRAVWPSAVRTPGQAQTLLQNTASNRSPIDRSLCI